MTIILLIIRVTILTSARWMLFRSHWNYVDYWAWYSEHGIQSLFNTCLFGICSWSHTKPHTTQIYNRYLIEIGNRIRHVYITLVCDNSLPFWCCACGELSWLSNYMGLRFCVYLLHIQLPHIIVCIPTVGTFNFESNVVVGPYHELSHPLSNCNSKIFSLQDSKL